MSSKVYAFALESAKAEVKTQYLFLNKVHRTLQLFPPNSRLRSISDISLSPSPREESCSRTILFPNLPLPEPVRPVRQSVRGSLDSGDQVVCNGSRLLGCLRSASEGRYMLAVGGLVPGWLIVEGFWLGFLPVVLVEERSQRVAWVRCESENGLNGP